MPDKPTGSLKAFGMAYDQGPQQSDASLDARERGEGAPEELTGLDKLLAYESGEVEVPDPAPVEREEPEPVEQEAASEEDDDNISEQNIDVLLDQAAGLIPPPSDSEEEGEEPRISRTEQQMREMFAKQQGRLEALEERIRERQQQPEPSAEPPQAEDEGPDYDDPRVQRLLAEALSDPSRVGPTLKVLVETEAKRLINKQVGPLAEQLGKQQATIEDTQKRSEANAQIAEGLRTANQLGGIEAAVVRQAERHGPNSMLVQYLKENPALATSAKGIVAAVMTVARAVQLKEGQSELPSNTSPAPAAPSLTAGSRPSVSSKRGQKLNKPKKEEKTEEEQIREAIRNARRPSQKLEFMR